MEKVAKHKNATKRNVRLQSGRHGRNGDYVILLASMSVFASAPSVLAIKGIIPHAEIQTCVNNDAILLATMEARTCANNDTIRLATMEMGSLTPVNNDIIRLVAM